MTARKDSIDVTGQQVGTIYADALYGAAETTGHAPATVIAELNSLVSDVLDHFPDFERLLASQMISGDEKRAIVDRTLAGKVSSLVLDFLKVLAERERLGYLRPIVQALHALHNERMGRVHVEITTAEPLDAAGAQRMEQLARRMLNRDPDLVSTVNPDIIGGILLKVGDTVFDASVAH